MKRIISFLLSMVLLLSSIICVDLSVLATANTDKSYFNIENFFENYQNKADDFNYLQYVSQHYTSDESKSTIEFRINQDTNCFNLVDYLKNNLWFKSNYAIWETATFVTNPVEIIGRQLNKETYYETIILRILNSAVTSDNAIDWLNQGAVKNSVKISKQIAQASENSYYFYLANKHISISDLTNEEYEKTIEFTKNYINSQGYKKFGKDISYLSDLLSMSKDIEEYSEKLASYCQLIELGDAVANCLEEIKNNSDDKDLVNAIDKVIPIIKDSYSDMLKTAAKEGLYYIGSTALKKIVGDTWKKCLINLLNSGYLYDGTAIVGSVFLTIGITKTFVNIAFSTDAKLDQYELMKALCSFEQSMETVIYKKINAFKKTDEYANVLLEEVDILYQTYIVDTEVYSEMTRICQNDWIGNLSKEEYEKIIKICSYNKELYQNEYDSLKIISGLCGDAVGWIVLDDGSLLIYGIGNMNDYVAEKTPWYGEREKIKEIYVSAGITRIGNYAFNNLINVNNVIVFTSPVECGSCCFDKIGTDAEIVALSNIYFSGSQSLNNNIRACKDLRFFDRKSADIEITDNTTLIVHGDVNMISVCGIDSGLKSSLTVNGRVEVHGNVNIEGGAEMDYWFHPINLHINGIMSIDGDFTTKGTGSQTGSRVHLYLTQESSRLIVNGTFEQEDFTGDLSNGTIELRGDYNGKLTCNGNSTVILNGDKKQTIRELRANNLIIENTSQEGVVFDGISCCAGGVRSKISKIENGQNLYLSGGYFMDDEYHGDIALENVCIKKDVTVFGDINLQGTVNIAENVNILGDLYCSTTEESNINILSGATVNVDGNANFVTKPVYIKVIESSIKTNDGAILNINGNLTVSGSSHPQSNWSFHWLNFYINGIINVKGNFEDGILLRFYEQSVNGYFKVEGDYTQNYFQGEISNGIIEMKGNYTGNIKTSGDNLLVLNGTNTQMLSGKLNFSNLQINNKNGIHFNSNLTVTNLFNHNGNSFTLYNDGKGSIFPDYDGDSYKDNIDPYPLVKHPAEHDYVFVRTVAPTCLKQGYDEYICSYCNEIDKRNLVDGIPHNYSFTKTVSPTCTTQGYDLYSCTNCSSTEKRNTVDSTGHSYEVTCNTATCTEDGVKTSVCSKCGDTITSNVSALGHTYNKMYKAPTCTQSGGYTNTCSRCGDTTYNIYSSRGHDYGDCTGQKYLNKIYDNNGQFIESIPGTTNYYGETFYTTASFGTNAFRKIKVSYPQEIRLEQNDLDFVDNYKFYVSRWSISLGGTLNNIFAYDTNTGRLPQNSAIPYTDKSGNLVNMKFVDYKTNGEWINGEFLLNGDEIIDLTGSVVCVDFTEIRPHIVFTRNYALENGIMNDDGTVNVDLISNDISFSAGIPGIYTSIYNISIGNYISAFKHDEKVKAESGVYYISLCFNSSNYYTTGNIVFKIYDKDKLIKKTPATVSTDEKITYTCIDCGETHTETSSLDLKNFKIKTVSVSLESSITMNYKVLKSAVADFNEPFIEFTRNGKSTVVREYIEQGDYYIFEYTDIAPQCMNDTVTAVLHAKHNGIDYSSAPLDFSVARYAYGMLDMYSGNKYAKLRTLLVDLLNYGAESQKYQNYRTNDLVNAKLTETQKSWASAQALNLTNVTDTKYKTVDNPTVEWKSAGLQLNDSVAVRYKFTAKNIDGLQLKVTCGASEWIYTSDDFTYNGDGTYTFLFNDLNADKMQEDIFITAISGNKAVSNTMRYSVESYAKQVQDSMPDSSLRNLTDAMMRYGISASNYA